MFSIHRRGIGDGIGEQKKASKNIGLASFTLKLFTQVNIRKKMRLLDLENNFYVRGKSWSFIVGQ